MRRGNTHYSWSSNNRSHPYAELKQYSPPPNFHLHYLYPGRPMEAVTSRDFIIPSNAEVADKAFQQNRTVTKQYAQWLQAKTLGDAQALGANKGVKDKITFHPAVDPDLVNEVSLRSDTTFFPELPQAGSVDVNEIPKKNMQPIR